MEDLLYRSILFQGHSKLLDGMTALRRQGARRLRKHGCPGGSNSGSCSKATKGEGRHCCCIVLCVVLTAGFKLWECDWDWRSERAARKVEGEREEIELDTSAEFSTLFHEPLVSLWIEMEKATWYKFLFSSRSMTSSFDNDETSVEQRAQLLGGIFSPVSCHTRLLSSVHEWVVSRRCQDHVCSQFTSANPA